MGRRIRFIALLAVGLLALGLLACGGGGGNGGADGELSEHRRGSRPVARRHEARAPVVRAAGQLR